MVYEIIMRNNYHIYIYNRGRFFIMCSTGVWYRPQKRKTASRERSTDRAETRAYSVSAYIISHLSLSLLPATNLLHNKIIIRVPNESGC
jgi:hypothetical protein